MEYKRAYYNEEPDRQLIWRHEQEIFPLLGKRHLFSQVAFFELYDFIDDKGKLNENVFAYSNKSGNERAIICYHNKYEETSGWIKNSVGRNVSSTDQPQLNYKTIAQALEFSSEENVFYFFKDYKTNLQYIRSGKDFHSRGLYVKLSAFQHHIFMDFKEVHDTDGIYGRLTAHLHGKGVPDIDDELMTVRLFPLYLKLFDLINSETVEFFKNILCKNDLPQTKIDSGIKSIINAYEKFIQQGKSLLNSSGETSTAVDDLNIKLQTLLSHINNNRYFGEAKFGVIEFTDRRNCLIFYIWCLLHSLERMERKISFNIMRLDKAFADIFASFDFEKEQMKESIDLIKILISENYFNMKSPEMTEEFFKQPNIQEFIKLNETNGIRYFNKERFEQLMKWIFTVSILIDSDLTSTEIKINKKTLDTMLERSRESGYKFDEFLKRKQ
jgi:hypothetical protein